MSADKTIYQDAKLDRIECNNMNICFRKESYSKTVCPCVSRLKFYRISEGLSLFDRWFLIKQFSDALKIDAIELSAKRLPTIVS